MSVPEAEAQLALRLERDAYHVHAKIPDTSEQFGDFYKMHKPNLWRTGSRFFIKPVWPNTDKPRVAFVMDNASGIAHGANLFKLLQCLRDYPQDIEPFVFTGQPADETFLKAIGDVPYFCFRTDNDYKSMIWLRTLCQRNSITSVVFVSIACGMVFAQAMRVAPSVIWWSQKWHSLDVPGLGLITTTHPFRPMKILEGNRWWCARQSLPRLYNKNHESAAADLRKQHNLHGYKTIFGWFGREEKLGPPDILRDDYKYFADSVCQILKEVPNSCFLWTSRTPHVFGSYLSNANVTHKCIGWVDTSLWTQVVDIGLDSYPFGMGHTAYQMWEAGKPVVGVANENPGALNTMFQLCEEGPFELKDEANKLITVKPYTASFVDFVDLAIALGKDIDMQKKMGEEGRLFTDTYMRNDKLFADTFSSALLEIIAEQKNND